MGKNGRLNSAWRKKLYSNVVYVNVYTKMYITDLQLYNIYNIVQKLGVTQGMDTKQYAKS